MAQQAWQAQDFMGLTPAIDQRRSKQIFLLEGSRNLAFTTTGPVSAFGNRRLLPHPINNPEHIQGVRSQLRLGDRSFVFTSDSILEWDEKGLGGWRVLAILPTITTAHRWTHGYLNGVIYFCHPRVGIMELDIETKVCQPIQGVGLPPAPMAITVNNGRLVVLTDQVIAWSWQSNGRDFTPALGEAGAQRIAARVGGSPIGLSNYAGGVITWTTGGALRSEFTGDQEVYRHREINSEFRPINSFCILQTDENTSVILDERGLFKTQGEAPIPYTPLFNEFLKAHVQRNLLKLDNNMRIEYDFYRQQMYVCESQSRYNPIYEQAYVLNPNLDKWSTFNEKFYGLLPIVISSSTREGDYFGFVGEDGIVRYWSGGGTREAPTTNSTLNLYYPTIQKPSHIDDGGEAFVSSSSMTFGFEPEPEFRVAGYYEDEGSVLAPVGVMGLDAFLRVGLIRVEGLSESHDQMAEVQMLAIGNTVTGDRQRVGQQFSLVPEGVGTAEFESVVGSVDWLPEPMNYVNHGLRLIGTLDGQSEFYSEVPELTLFNRAVRHYACVVSGVWHILEMSATKAGEGIHLQTFELTATYAGRVA